jgi:hypothetical protein
MARKLFEYPIRTKTEIKYGYLLINDKIIKDAWKFFPEKPFTVNFNGKLLYDRKYDRKRKRLNLYPIRKYFYKRLILIFSVDNNIIQIDMKDPPKAIEIKIIQNNRKEIFSDS